MSGREHSPTPLGDPLGDPADRPGEAPPGDRFDDAFDDALGLAARSFAGVDLISFHGRSGAGKSAAIRFLLAEHPDLRQEGGAAPREGVTVFDDLLGPRETLDVVRALRRGRRVLAACHFHPRWLAPLGLRWRTVAFDLDAHPEKIERWLTARGIAHTHDAVRHFCHHYGANYTDAAIILERSPGQGFDQALSRFLRNCRIE